MRLKKVLAIKHQHHIRLSAMLHWLRAKEGMAGMHRSDARTCFFWNTKAFNELRSAYLLSHITQRNPNVDRCYHLTCGHNPNHISQRTRVFTHAPLTQLHCEKHAPMQAVLTHKWVIAGHTGITQHRSSCSGTFTLGTWTVSGGHG